MRQMRRLAVRPQQVSFYRMGPEISRFRRQRCCCSVILSGC